MAVAAVGVVDVGTVIGVVVGKGVAKQWCCCCCCCCVCFLKDCLLCLCVFFYGPPHKNLKFLCSTPVHERTFRLLILTD